MPKIGGVNFSDKEVAEFNRLEFVWVTMKDKRVCPSCLDRGGYESKKFGEWESIGLPKSGTTICGVKCRCVLVPDNVIGFYPSILGKPVNLRDDENFVISKNIEYGRYTYLDDLIEKYKSVGRNLPKEYYNVFDLEERITFLEGILNG